MKLIQRLLQLKERFKNRNTRQINPTSFTTESATGNTPTRKQLYTEIRKKKDIPHEDLMFLAHAYFGVRFEKCFYVMKGGSNTGMYFEVQNVNFIEDDSGDLSNIVLALKDRAFDTSTIITISVTDLPLVMDQFKPNFSSLQISHQTPHTRKP